MIDLKKFEYSSELRIFKAKVINIDDNFIYIEIPEKSKEIRTNIVLTSHFTNSLANFMPIRPKQGDEIFVLYEEGKDQLPVALLLGRNKFNEIDKENAYLRVDILHIFKSGIQTDDKRFFKFDFKEGKYEIKLEDSYIKIINNQIYAETSNLIKLYSKKTIDETADQNIKITGKQSVNIDSNQLIELDTGGQAKITLNLSGFQIQSNITGLIKSTAMLTISGKPLVLQGAGMTITLSENIFEMNPGTTVNFKGNIEILKLSYNGEIIFCNILGLGPIAKFNTEKIVFRDNVNEKKHLVYWEDLNEWWAQIKEIFDNHTHNYGNTPVSPPLTKFSDFLSSHSENIEINSQI